jgi:phage shock protein PspC (stress-responsive transcriptional regulator)
VSDQPRPALRRRTEGRFVAGVAGGLADWLNAPVGFVRVLILFAGGQASEVLIAYAVAALLLPPRGHSRPSWDNLIGVGRLGLLLGVPSLVLGALDLTVLFDEQPGVWIPVVALTLIGALILFSADFVRGPRTDAEARTTVLAAAPVGGFAAALTAAVILLPGPRWDYILPAGVLIAGAAALFGALTGRVRPFVAPAVVAVVVCAGLLASDVRLQGGVGDVSLTRNDVVDGSLVVRRAFGDVTVDLRHLESNRPISLVASVGKGRLRIAVPKQVRVEVDARVGDGRIDSGLINQGFSQTAGFNREVHRTHVSRESKHIGAPRIHVVADVGVGEIGIGSGRDYLASAISP